MTFSAMLRRFSPLWRQWQEMHRISGEIGGAMFHWAPGDDYATTEPLNAAQVNALREFPDVIIEMIGTPPVEPDEPQEERREHRTTAHSASVVARTGGEVRAEPEMRPFLPHRGRDRGR